MTEERKRTQEILAEALKESGAPSKMVSMAMDGYYDEFRGPLALPLMQLVADCRKYNLTRFAKRVKEGEFDAQSWEVEEWGESEEGRMMRDAFLSGFQGPQPKDTR